MIVILALISAVGAASIHHHAHPLPLNLEVKIGQIFHDMDTNKDFFISSTEISIFFSAFDLDNLDGAKPVSIDLNEFKQSWDYGDSEAQKEHNFRQMDVNNDGALTEIDLLTVFVNADQNANGVLDFGEFDKYMRTVIYNNVS
uniref:Uncharacterized protein LOC111126762 n=1 Tax=Crassostrea virginica TaxID=6565 RepID=A0A8B8DHZ5_CRAVI|nr:uncharacterized protein LOC111126762 [Crassostrea virginica]